MKLQVAAANNYKGKVVLTLRASDGDKSGLPKGLVMPETVGKAVIVSRGPRPGELEAVLSLGKKASISSDTLRCCGGAIVSFLRENSVTAAGVKVEQWGELALDECLALLAEGSFLRDYSFAKYRTGNSSDGRLSIDLLVGRSGKRLTQRLQLVRDVCAATTTARDIAHEPPNIINPVSLAKRARSLAAGAGLRCRVYDHRQLERMKANALLAVGKASKTPSRLIVLEYPGIGKAAGKPLVIVGKAITFDTGGYSLKTKDSILGMKYDKCGGAAVMGIMQAVSKCKPNQPVVGIIAAAENMISGEAYRPDDIIKTMSGKTVQVVSADAEGRMVLCDALTYAQRNYKPRAIVDIATLTGGVVIALGKHAAGVFCNDDRLCDALIASGERTHERLWRLPLWDEYFEAIKGDDSDFKNSGGREAHASVGAIFLKQFVDEKIPWAHIDIAAVADVDRDTPYCPKGATGFGVRLMVDYILGK